MASLQERNGVWNCIFRYQGKRHWYNIGEVEESEAQAASARVDYLLLRIKQHLIEVPAGCSPAEPASVSPARCEYRKRIERARPNESC